MKKKSKHPKDMTTDEAIAHVFHPKALKHLRKHMEKITEEKASKKVNK